MNAGQLRTILEHVPDDLEVLLWGQRCWHVHEANRRVSVPRYGVAPALVLSSWHPDGCVGDDFELHGPFRRPGELLAELDPDTPTGDP